MKTANPNKVLTAIREKKTSYNMITTLKDSNNKVKAILTGYNQPHKSQKQITVRKQTYNLIFKD